MITIMMTKLMTKMMATHHRPGQLNAVLFPHLESLAKVDYLDVVFLLQKIFFKTIPFMSSMEGGKIKCSIEPPPKISSHLVAEKNVVRFNVKVGDLKVMEEGKPLKNNCGEDPDKCDNQ